MTEVTHERSLEQVVSEQDFVPLLGEAGQSFHRVAGDLMALGATSWTKRQLFLLYTEADELESFLDDYGARTNQAFATTTELVASIRGFALAGLSMEHLVRRIAGYGALESLPQADREAARADMDEARAYIQRVLQELLSAQAEEARRLGVDLPQASGESDRGAVDAVHIRLHHDVGQEDIEGEEQRIAEVSSKYLQACAMLEEVRIRRMGAPERDRFMKERCSEERARVYEATVHNLQSSYDTFIKNTVLEAGDDRLKRLRGHISASLHLLEAVTQLTHFVERHESDVRHDAARLRLGELVPRGEVNRVTLDLLLYWADRLLRDGRGLAEDLLPSYTNLQSLQVELSEGLALHARPASLIVSIVNHYGTPVEMEVEGHSCNAGSILELMIAVGSNPETRCYSFRGDERPLRDIGALFEHSLGEQGLDSLPECLDYLRSL